MHPLSPKEVIIHIARRILGEARVHDYLIKRGIELRHLKDGYKNLETSENHEPSNGLFTEKACGKRPFRQTLVFMADGKWMHGGLTDRLRGMTSAYKFAVEHNLDFKIFHTSPFLLQEILEPNKVNWIIDKHEISYDSNVAKPALLYREDFDNVSALERQLDSSHQQFHLYSYVDSVGKKFSEYFNILFKPSPLLMQELSRYNKILGTNYISISFRFQNKLGDFKEFTFKELPEKDKQKLMKASLEMLKREISLNNEKAIPTSGNEVEIGSSQMDMVKPNASSTLVTADSPMFLAEAEKLPNVVTVKGNSIHIDFNGSKKVTDYLKAFTEFFLISKAAKAKLYRNSEYKTYPSNFPKYAASLGNVPYEIIEE